MGVLSWRKPWCRRRDSNLRPKAYESFALPLSYVGLFAGEKTTKPRITCPHPTTLTAITSLHIVASTNEHSFVLIQRSRGNGPVKLQQPPTDARWEGAKSVRQITWAMRERTTGVSHRWNAPHPKDEGRFRVSCSHHPHRLESHFRPIACPGGLLLPHALRLYQDRWIRTCPQGHGSIDRSTHPLDSNVPSLIVVASKSLLRTPP